jgi:hypothetical protein
VGGDRWWEVEEATEEIDERERGKKKTEQVGKCVKFTQIYL